MEQPGPDRPVRAGTSAAKTETPRRQPSGLQSPRKREPGDHGRAIRACPFSWPAEPTGKSRRPPRLLARASLRHERKQADADRGHPSPPRGPCRTSTSGVSFRARPQALATRNVQPGEEANEQAPARSYSGAAEAAKRPRRTPWLATAPERQRALLYHRRPRPTRFQVTLAPQAPGQIIRVRTQESPRLPRPTTTSRLERLARPPRGTRTERRRAHREAFIHASLGAPPALPPNASPCYSRTGGRPPSAARAISDIRRVRLPGADSALASRSWSFPPSPRRRAWAAPGALPPPSSRKCSTEKRSASGHCPRSGAEGCSRSRRGRRQAPPNREDQADRPSCAAGTAWCLPVGSLSTAGLSRQIWPGPAFVLAPSRSPRARPVRVHLVTAGLPRQSPPPNWLIRPAPAS